MRGLLLRVLALLLAGAAPWTSVTRAAKAPPAPPPIEEARAARALEDIGAYASAADGLRALRRRVVDADLELALALDDARSSRPDSALARLEGPLLSAAAIDSMPLMRRHEYPWDREQQWVNGAFDGWHWYVWRARAELLAAGGEWPRALAAARQCVAARPMSGKEWLILAVAAGRAGQDAEAAAAAQRAAFLDPILPEAHYLAGLWAWRSGRRAEATEWMRRARGLDSTWREPTLAGSRLRLPGAPPDPLPVEFFHGIRRTALLTSPDRPKLEEFDQMEVAATLMRRVDPPSEPPREGVKPVQLFVSVLVDADGHIVLADLPWFTAEHLPPEKLTRALATLPEWEFVPARKSGEPHPVWSAVEFMLNP